MRSFALFGALTALLGGLVIAEGCGRALAIDPDSESDAATSTGGGGNADAGGSDGALDAANVLDPADASDAADASDVVAACPDVCTSCSNAGTCLIECPGPKCPGQVTCPEGRPCRVECKTSSNCVNTMIGCAVDQPCTVVCNTQSTCSNLQVTAAPTTNLCLECMGNCSYLTCMASSPTCERRCGPKATCSEFGCTGCIDRDASCP